MKSRLRKLKQSWTIWEYVKEFTTRVLEILELSDQDSIFYFLDGLQGWAKTELERRGVQDLATTIAHVDALIDFSLRKDSSKPKDRKKASLNGTSAHEDEGVSDGESMGSMRILIAIKTKTDVLKVVGKNLQYLGATINGVNARALVDFVNSEAKSIHGAAKDVLAKKEEWEGMIDLSVVLVDDFKVILRLEFLDKMRAFLISFANSLCVLDGGKTCMVNTERDDKSGAKILLTMQFKKGFNRREPCYLAVTRLDADEGSSKVEVLKVIERVLDEFKDVTPKELPKKLPPRREVDRTIELETGSNPPTKAPYWMPPPELEEKAIYFTKLDLRSRYYQVWIAKGDEAKTTCLMSQVLGTQDQGWKIDDGRSKDKGYPRLRTTNQGYGVEIFTWLGELYLKVHHGVLGHNITFDRPIEEEPTLDMGQRMSSSVREFEEEEPKVKRDEKEVHGARERDDEDYPSLEDVETLFVGFEIQGLEHDPLAKKIIALAKDRKTWRFWLKGDMLFTKGAWLYVPTWGDLRRLILKKCHDSKWAGHSRIKRTLILVEGTYYWPRMEDNVETFVRTVVQDHEDEFELLHEFSSPNRQEKGEARNKPDRLQKDEGMARESRLSLGIFDKMAKKMKKWADERRRHIEFEVGDQVMVKLLPQQFKSLRKVHKGLTRRYEGHFSVIRCVGKKQRVSSYKEYLIKWRDLPDSEASWKVEDLLWQFAFKIKRYHKDGMTRTP
nr:hypothetical protein CTI12_AA187700 [Tanacetum cinerariifolium]